MIKLGLDNSYDEALIIKTLLESVPEDEENSLIKDILMMTGNEIEDYDTISIGPFLFVKRKESSIVMEGDINEASKILI